MGQTIEKVCKLCGEETSSIYNINLKGVLICDACGNTIFMQQATWLGKNEWDRIKEQKDETKTNS